MTTDLPSTAFLTDKCIGENPRPVALGKLSRTNLLPYVGRLVTYTARVGAISSHRLDGEKKGYVMLRHLRKGESYIDNHVWTLQTSALGCVKVGDWIRFRAVAQHYLRGGKKAARQVQRPGSNGIGIFGVRAVETIKRNPDE